MIETPNQFQAIAFFQTEDAGSPKGGIREAAARLEAMGMGDWQMSLILGTARINPAQAQSITGHQYQSPDNRWTVRILPTQISVLHELIDPEQPLEPVEAFADRAAKILYEGLARREKKAKRVAMIQSRFWTEIGDELEAVGGRMLQLPRSLNSPPPFEWEFKAASRISRAFGGTEELTNTIAGLQRNVFMVQVQKGRNQIHRMRFEGLSCSTDINTVQERTEDRLAPEQVSDFVASSLAWHGQLIEDVKSQAFGAGA